MPPSKDFKPCQNCRLCSVKFTEQNKVKKQNLCRDCNSKLCKEYKKKNPKIISDYNKIYKAENKKEISVYNSEYNLNNREAIQKRQTAQHKERRENDPNYLMTCKCRSELHHLFTRSNSDSLHKLTNCTTDFLKEWFEYKFTPEMTLENYGEYWHIDHIVPCSLFNLLDPEQLKTCFHWTNLQPLEAKVNRSKVNKLNKNELFEHILMTIRFIYKTRYRTTQRNISNPKLLDFLLDNEHSDFIEKVDGIISNLKKINFSLEQETDEIII